jgi:hypothetical protein
MIARRKFKEFRDSIGFEELCEAATRKGVNTCWSGYEVEGMTASMWLTRAGLPHLAPLVLEKRQNGQVIRKSTSLKKLLAMKEKALRKLGVGEPLDVNLILATTYDHAPRVDGFDFLKNEEQVLRICLKAYPQKVRATNLTHSVMSSSTPITLAMLRRHLKVYAGKPKMAQDNIHEIQNLDTSSHPEALKEVRDAFKRCAERCIILAGTKNVRILRDTCQEILTQVLDLDTAKDLETRKRAYKTLMGRADCKLSMANILGVWEKTGMDEDYDESQSVMRQCLILRAAVFEILRTWSANSLRIQTWCRCCIKAKAWNLIRASRRASILYVQQVYRRHTSKKIANLMREQQKSLWEQLWNEEAQVYYYFHKPTGRSRWKPPRGPFRPTIFHSYTGQRMLAWPQLDVVPGTKQKQKTEEWTRPKFSSGCVKEILEAFTKYTAEIEEDPENQASRVFVAHVWDNENGQPFELNAIDKVFGRKGAQKVTLQAYENCDSTLRRYQSSEAGPFDDWLQTMYGPFFLQQVPEAEAEGKAGVWDMHPKDLEKLVLVHRKRTRQKRATKRKLGDTAKGVQMDAAINGGWMMV